MVGISQAPAVIMATFFWARLTEWLPERSWVAGATRCRRIRSTIRSRAAISLGSVRACFVPSGESTVAPYEKAAFCQSWAGVSTNVPQMPSASPGELARGLGAVITIGYILFKSCAFTNRQRFQIVALCFIKIIASMVYKPQ